MKGDNSYVIPDGGQSDQLDLQFLDSQISAHFPSNTHQMLWACHQISVPYTASTGSSCWTSHAVAGLERGIGGSELYMERSHINKGNAVLPGEGYSDRDETRQEYIYSTCHAITQWWNSNAPLPPTWQCWMLCESPVNPIMLHIQYKLFCL